MRVTLNISDNLVSEVQKISGEKSKTNAIIIAMKAYVRQEKIKELIALRGKVQIDYDWKKEEEIEMRTQKELEKLHKRKK